MRKWRMGEWGNERMENAGWTADLGMEEWDVGRVHTHMCN